MPSTKGAVADQVAVDSSSSGNARGLKGWWYAAVLLSAFLLFQVELIIGKFVLPWFGGAPATWITCLLFFQVVLLAGYSYAHLLMSARPRVQAACHTGLLAVSVLLLGIMAFRWRTPITPSAAWKPFVIDHPTWQVLKLLAASVGVPFLLLSSTAPLLQSWFAKLRPSESAYPLYAASNLGSLLALLSYPLLVEPNLSLLSQGWTWSAAYVLFVMICAGCAGKISAERRSTSEVSKVSSGSVPLLTRILWVGLAACGSAMLLAVTNMISQEVAVVPFLWVLPLALYLLSFVACFARKTLYRRWLFHPLFATTAILVLLANRGPILLEIAAYLLLLFAVCMSCHGELVRLKPDETQLTSFYLSIALGGAIGSVFVSLIAPQIFIGLWEMPVSLITSGALVCAALFYDRRSWFYESPAWLPIALVWGLLIYFRGVALWFNIAADWSLYPYVLMVAITLISLRLLKRHSGRPLWGWFQPVQFFVVALLAMLTFYSVAQMRSFTNGAVLASRNFFGILKVTREPMTLQLRHGRTFHGSQVNDPAHRDEPTSYYIRDSGIGILLTDYPKKETSSLRVGVVGLGVGTLAAYGRAGDYYRFYDINPDVYRLSAGSQPVFTFLADSKAKSDVEIGDARLLMEAELGRGEPQHFDVLALDAFNSDAIPVHLLTKEAVQLYLQHLNHDGVLAVHISNRSLDLAPVLAGIARYFQLECADVDFNVPPMQASRWVLLSRNRNMLRTPKLKQRALYGAPAEREELWTDDYSNLVRLIKWPK